MKVLKTLLCLSVLVITADRLLAVEYAYVEWIKRYSDPTPLKDDWAHALAVDNAGNVYVTGVSQGSGSDHDYATIKYAPNGDTLWVRRYNGTGNGPDEGRALVVDDSGNVYVTGYSPGSGTGIDYATIKYSSNGTLLWASRYEGPGNYDDRAFALTVDDNGNVYVTGYSASGITQPDYATIKYAPNGDTLWVRSEAGYGGGRALVIDDSGNVHVTGSSRTIKYSSAGQKIWETGSGEVDGTALAIDASGNVYVTGTSNSDFKTIKYNSNGVAIWTKTYNGPGNGDDGASDLKIDNSGNVYVSGFSTGNGSGTDYATIKYAPNGDTVWVRRYDGPAHFHDEAYSLALDDSGGVYVTGYISIDGLFDVDYATIKYSPVGDTLWVRQYDGPVDPPDVSYDWAEKIVVDANRRVYITGLSGNTSFGSGEDYATIKYVWYTCVAKSGDANADGNVNLADLVYLSNYVYKGGPAPSPYCSGDVNADGVVNQTDVVYLSNYIYKGGPAPIKSKECCL